MKRLLAALGLATMGAALGCLLKGWHDAKRHPMGSFKCSDCKRSFRDLEDAGTLPDGRVNRTRAYSRENGGTFLRGSIWREER